MLKQNGEKLVLLFLQIAVALLTSMLVDHGAIQTTITTVSAGRASSIPRARFPSGRSPHAGRTCCPHSLRASQPTDDDRAFLPLLSRNYSSNRLTYSPSDDSHPALSPGGEMVVFLRQQDGQADIFSLDVADRTVTNLTQTPLADEDTPVFSPDGSQIAFASNRSGDWDIYLMRAAGTDVRAAIRHPGTDELHPSFGPEGQWLAFATNRDRGNWEIYTKTIASESAWSRLTDDPAIDRFPAVSADGKTVAFRRSREGNSEICLIDAGGSNLRQLTHHTAFDGYPSLFPDGSGVVFASTRSGTESIYLTNIAGTGLTELKQGPEWRAINPRISADGRQVIYAGGKLGDPLDIYKRALTSPLLTIGYQGASNLEKHCEWEEGVLAFGWIQAWRATGDTQYRQWAEGWVDVCVPLRPNVAHVNDGLLGYAALTAYETTQQPEYLDYAERVADYFLHTAPRTSDGTLTHDSHRVWVDTLLGSVPFLTKMSQVSGESLYLEEAISQTVRHAEHLQDPDTGLYRHAWDETGSNPAGQPFWGRGNGWAMMANVTLLSKMPVTHTSRSVVLDSVQRQAAGLQPLQDSSGLWHTVLTRPDSYLETSATMLIGYGLEQGVQHGWLDEAEFSEPTRAARLGVWRRVTADGTVTGVSGPTWPRETAEDYAAIPHGGLRLYGQGLALLLESPR